MILIKLTDNNYQGEEFSLSGISDDERILVRKALDEINNVSVKELADRGLIIFPSQSAKSDLDDGKKTIFTVQHLTSDEPIIKTSNIMGFFSVGGVRFEIRSRFDSDDQQFFLHYMLQKVCNAAPTTNPTDAKRDKFYDFIVYLFPWYLKKAVAQGLFRAYIRRDYNDSNIRGAIDFPRHFRYNIPFNGKIAYRTREYSHDNSITQLVRHTIEFIAENHNLRGILAVDKEMRDAVQLIRGTTESYNRFSRESVIRQNLRTNLHPYYTEYEPLRKLCISILTHEKRSFGDDSKNELSGILFDGAALWEEFLNVVMKEHIPSEWNLEHPNNRTGSGKKYLFVDEDENKTGQIYPDFILKKSDNVSSIVDAKYKHKVDNSDYFQILAYMFRFNCDHGMLIYPYSKNETYSKNEREPKKELKLAEHKAVRLSVYGIEIPDYKNNEEIKVFDEFQKKMNSVLSETFSKILQ